MSFLNVSIYIFLNLRRFIKCQPVFFIVPFWVFLSNEKPSQSSLSHFIFYWYYLSLTSCVFTCNWITTCIAPCTSKVQDSHFYYAQFLDILFFHLKQYMSYNILDDSPSSLMAIVYLTTPEPFRNLNQLALTLCVAFFSIYPLLCIIDYRQQN